MLIPGPSHIHSFVQWGIPPAKLFFSVSVVDNDWFFHCARALRPRREEIRRELGLPEKFFLGVGRQVPKKNWTMCLEAYRQYRARSNSSGWGLVLVGEGPSQSLLKDLVQREQIPGVVFPGIVQGAALVAYYVLAQVHVLPSLHGETWGLVVNEAMACGLPVLVSEQCGCAESLVRNGVNGWTFSPHRPEELAERMQRMAGLPDDEYRKMASASEEIIRAWGLEQFVQGVEAALAACRDVNHGFLSSMDKLLISLWNGRFRPT